MIELLFENRNDRAKRYLNELIDVIKSNNLDNFGRMGVEALKSATPIDTGETADSWGYRIEHHDGYDEIVWYNTKHNQGENIAVLIQYGHATGTGGYVYPVNYINPALVPVYESLKSYIEGRIIKL